jgi:hypothetical protein
MRVWAGSRNLAKNFKVYLMGINGVLGEKIKWILKWD